jgi:hypothetical protein
MFHAAMYVWAYTACVLLLCSVKASTCILNLNSAFAGEKNTECRLSLVTANHWFPTYKCMLLSSAFVPDSVGNIVNESCF